MLKTKARPIATGVSWAAAGDRGAEHGRAEAGGHAPQHDPQLPTSEKIFALMYLLNVPCVRQPSAWTVRSGIGSRFWWASYSIS